MNESIPPVTDEPVGSAKANRGDVFRFRLMLMLASLMLGLVVTGVMFFVLIRGLEALRQKQSSPIVAPMKGGKVPDFELTERSGKTVGLKDLKGRIWVAGFVFTRCHETCPMVSGVMASLRAELPQDVQLVTFTVDPRYDSPDVLREYARNYKAEDSWWFLTGPRDAIYKVIIDGFKLAVEENPDITKLPGERISHSTRLVVVNREGEISGYYDSADPSLVRGLVKRVEELREQP